MSLNQVLALELFCLKHQTHQALNLILSTVHLIKQKQLQMTGRTRTERKKINGENPIPHSSRLNSLWLGSALYSSQSSNNRDLAV